MWDEKIASQGDQINNQQRRSHKVVRFTCTKQRVSLWIGLKKGSTDKIRTLGGYVVEGNGGEEDSEDRQ